MKELDLGFADEYEFAELLLDLIGKEVAILADYEYMNELIKALLTTNEGYHFECVELDNQCGTHLIEIDTNMGIWICPAENLTEISDDIYFVHQDVSSKLLKLIDNYYAFDFDYEIECNKECCNCDKYADEKDIVTHAENNSISQSWTDGKGSYFSRSFMSSNNRILDEIMKEWTAFANRF